MKCPHCHKSVSLFSREMNRMGKVKSCPHCAGAVKLKLDWMRYVLWAVPLLVVAVLLKPVMGYLGTGLAVGVAVLMSMGLEPAK